MISKGSLPGSFGPVSIAPYAFLQPALEQGWYPTVAKGIVAAANLDAGSTPDRPCLPAHTSYHNAVPRPSSRRLDSEYRTAWDIRWRPPERRNRGRKPARSGSRQCGG